MFNMFDLFRQAQGGAAFDNLARAYGMQPEQMRAAVAALTPAFAQAFQRQQATGDAQRFADLMQTEAYARAFEAHAAALDPENKSAGDDALGALFGSKDVSRAVAAQAAAVSGVQAEIIRKVLPVLASILVGGFMKAAQGAAQPAPGAGAGLPGQMAEFWSQMMRNAGAAPGASSGPAPKEGRPQEAGAMMMGDMMAEMLGSMFGGGAAKAGRGPEPEAPKEPPAGDGSRPEGPAAGTPFDEIVETGRELSAQNAKAMEQIFEAFFSTRKDGG
ncbi:DUF937 domain-containing protein [Hansschlegelia plantiphila]|uniref:DUF937 domain-containing protein n=1 Tax=Hansschlegelia plantiphila TaxID=374655 RepID=A0A9W6MVG6_9HYPH|nr:DUF937 domain-containing protein [Hansschlegelia plantiphila]GLK67705.1 hypothetical protein GCM10008179_13430 [Hansschlegelia plantiphila]